MIRRMDLSSIIKIKSLLCRFVVDKIMKEHCSVMLGNKD